MTDVHREYQQGEFVVKALQGVSLSIEPGEFTVLWERLVQAKRLYSISLVDWILQAQDLYKFDGQELASMAANDLSDLRLHKLGFVFQAYNLIPVLSAFENTEFVPLMQGVGVEERRTRSMEMLKAVGLGGMEHRLPSELSGGQQQRVAVARALAGNPMLILADEPTANLDSKTGKELIALMRSLNEEKGVTFIFATHDPKVMEAAKRIIHLEDGKIIEDERR